MADSPNEKSQSERNVGSIGMKPASIDFVYVVVSKSSQSIHLSVGLC